MKVCDCYIDYCASCKKPIPMHLGDFETDRWEIQIFCNKCWERVKIYYLNFPYIIWRIEDANPEVKQDHKDLYEKEKQYIGERITVVALTTNAYENRYCNHPNLVLELKKEEEYTPI